MHLPVLSILILLPIFSGVLILLINDESQPDRGRYIALMSTVFSLFLCATLYQGFDLNTFSMQFTETVSWLPMFGINYELGVDGISMPLILLTTFTTLIVLLTTWQSVNRKIAQYLAAFMVLQGLLVGVFSALNAILFYIFWEATLVPMYLIIGIWGSENRIYAALKFFIYTFLGSALLLIALIYLGVKAGTFNLLEFYPLKISLTAQYFIFIAFLAAFAIKVPMWPVHTWLPDAHTEAPAGGSIVLAAILLKLGAYGFLRFTLPIVPDASRALAGFMIFLSLIAIVYIAFIAIVQRDMKKLIAYSSISHMGFVTLGCFMIYFILNNTGNIMDAGLGLEGAIFIMLSHGLISSALFAAVGTIYDRMHTRMIDDLSGLVNSMPLFASLFVLFSLANCGLPGTSGFVGEFMVILNSMKANFWFAFTAGTTLILGAAYSLWLVKRVVFGTCENTQILALEDIAGFELMGFALLGVAIVLFGVYPGPVIDVLHKSSAHILTLAQMSKL